MAQFTRYASTDSSAPVLTGATGSLVALLDATLVNGYGAKAAAGWVKSFAGTSKAVYRPGAGNQFYLRVQDDGPGAGTFKEARLFGYETIADVDAATNTGPFPTTAQMATGLFARKSATADATARAWKVFADNRTVYVFVQTGDTAGVYFAWAFGDFYSQLSGDAYRTILIARIAENSVAADRLDTLSSSLPSATTGHYVPRSYTGTGASLTVAKTGDSTKNGGSGNLTGVIPYPNGPDQSIYQQDLWISESTTGHLRGRLRGLYGSLHPQASAIVDGDTFSGAGSLAGRTFDVVKAGSNTTTYFIETSNTLDTN